MQFLLVEDERMMGWELHPGLRDEGFAVDRPDDGNAWVVACSDRVPANNL